MNEESKAGKVEKGEIGSSAPSISLPKGGGAIRGIGEKFAANPVTGTGSLSVPIATSPGRSGFGPQLSLTYDSGSGNGPFGFGWNLSLPSIIRKTDKGLPKYQDAAESDVFILSGAEDLVPCLKQDDAGDWQPEVVPPRTVDGKTYDIHRYLPRIEGLFARIERWTNQTDPADKFWRSISKDDITTWYGKSVNSRIFDPTDPARIFNWLICESYDDKGNVIEYKYKEEDSEKVDQAQLHERNRTLDTRTRKANRYLKRIRYGNHQPHFPKLEDNKPWPSPPGDNHWYFEVVFDYGEHDENVPLPQDLQNNPRKWECRHDPFSSYRAGFEIRTYRLCQRALMFHHFVGEDGVGKDCLVRSTDFNYRYEQEPDDPRNPIQTVLVSATQSGYQRKDAGGYLKKSLSPLEFEYSKATIQEKQQEIEAESLENLPQGLDGAQYQWADLDGEGAGGILTEQNGGWYYKRNLSPLPIKDEQGQLKTSVRFAPVETVTPLPSFSSLSSGQQQILDLAGDGQVDVVTYADPAPGFFERTDDGGWKSFKSFKTLPNINWQDPNLKFVDLTGDGHADIFITEDSAFTWYPSLAEVGFANGERVHQALDEEKGPKLVFADGTDSIYLSDLSGDGLSDLVRIRNGEVCYWPNLGYGRFGAKVTMDNAPWFDYPDQFDQKRIRLADIDGTGVTDILYLKHDGVRIYFNQSGNSWSDVRVLDQLPTIDNTTSVMAVDLMGNGTACLVWSSPLPGNAKAPMRYVDLMGGQKPHLLTAVVNNLGAETHVHYAPSTRFYLKDKEEGKPWITRLHFPVHVVERVETYDHVSRNHFVTRYAYHHGYFDGEEREFRGFGMVEQWDTEEFAAFDTSDEFPQATNIDEASHVPPVLTKTWFHTGAYLQGHRISRQFENEYYRESDESAGMAGLTDAQLNAMLLDDTVLSNTICLADGTSAPYSLSAEEAREACRALKGSILRQEIYSLDGIEEEDRPHSVSERNYTIELIQGHGPNRHAVFFTHAQETIDFHYERKLYQVGNHLRADPRVSHATTLAVDNYGNVKKSVAIGYGRRLNQQEPLFAEADHHKQHQTLITYTENEYTEVINREHIYRAPLLCETRSYEIIGLKPDANEPEITNLFRFAELHNKLEATMTSENELPYENYKAEGIDENKSYYRLIEHVRQLYLKDDLSVPKTLGQMDTLGLPYETYKLAFTPGLLNSIYKRDGQDLLPVDPTNQLRDEGGYNLSNDYKAQDWFPNTDPDNYWWIPSRQQRYSPADFYQICEVIDPFGAVTQITYDDYKLLLKQTVDALDNTVTAELDYRMLQPHKIIDPNGNRTQVSFDALGMVVGTAVMGKPEENLGDSLAGFEADLTEVTILDHLTNPLTDPHAILGRATTRLVYDLFAYQRTKDQPKPQPAVVYTLARETHDADLDHNTGEQTNIQHSFSYSDGFGREIQKKIQAEPEKINGVPGPPRWVGSGWTIFNNKGKPVRQYEPFFSPTHRFEFGVEIGVSPILFYDPVGRVVATLHPNHTYEKVIFDPWQQATYDVNDTLHPPLDPADPPFDHKDDPDVGQYFRRLPEDKYLPTWYEQRQGGGLGPQEQAAATKAAAHADTPTTAYFDTFGRTFLTVAHNKVVCPNHDLDGTEDKYCTRVELDIEGNQREVKDDRKKPDETREQRIVMRYDYYMAGPEQDENGEPTNTNRIHQISMEAGERWMLNDVTGKPIHAWDSRGHSFRTEYDPLRRPLRIYVTGADPADPNQELLTERLVYGEQHPETRQRNLRGQLYLHLDQVGAATIEAHDFKGNLLRASRRLTNGTQYRQAMDWRTVDADYLALPTDVTALLNPIALEAVIAPRLEGDTYTSRTTYDALNRPATLTTPHTPAMQFSVIRPTYNEANLLERVDVMLRGATINGNPDWTPFVTNVDYDAKGQRLLIDYGNGVRTSYEYDPLTFRLVHLLTRRNAVVFPDDCPQPQPSSWPGFQVQNLHYTYDPMGNITHVRDDAQQAIYFRNKRVEPSADYTYDAIYRLIEATGREHVGQIGRAPIPHSHNDTPRVGIDWSANDGNAMDTYTERYLYDAVGNFLEMQHCGRDPAHPSWTRCYVYEETSLIEDGTGVAPLKTSNRLSSTTVGSDPPLKHVHDVHGNITRMPHLGSTYPEANMFWDYQDQLYKADLGGGGTVYYVYDASGQRVRKVIERQNGMRQKERIYLGGFEIYREYNGNGTTVMLERETLHIMDDKQRIALVETKILDTADNTNLNVPLIRYQFSNHLGSTNLELDDQALIISYEEYTPYGSTSYQAVRSQTETPKRYRYTGKEKDEETGLYYYGARYYAAWLGRWCSCDPAGMVDGFNVYAYVRNNPLCCFDKEGNQTAYTDFLEQRFGEIEGQYDESSKDLDIPEPKLIIKTELTKWAIFRAAWKLVESTKKGSETIRKLMDDPQYETEITLGHKDIEINLLGEIYTYAETKTNIEEKETTINIYGNKINYSTILVQQGKLKKLKGHTAVSFLAAIIHHELLHAYSRNNPLTTERLDNSRSAERIWKSVDPEQQKFLDELKMLIPGSTKSKYLRKIWNEHYQNILREAYDPRKIHEPLLKKKTTNSTIMDISTGSSAN